MMMDSLGLSRLLTTETNVSDLLAFLTERDRSIWTELLGTAPAKAVREGRARTANRADVQLLGEDGSILASIEVKLGHHLDEDQQSWYEDSFEEKVKLFLVALDAESVADSDLGDRWTCLDLAELVGRWRESGDVEAATISAAMHKVLYEWSGSVAAVTRGCGDSEAVPLEKITQPFLGRVITRVLREPVRDAGAAKALASVTSGGGNAILMSWLPVEGDDLSRSYIAEVRWKPASGEMSLRFGLDYTDDGETARNALWTRAGSLDDVIRADRFVDHLAGIEPELADLLKVKGSGRPNPKGDWEHVIRHGWSGAAVKGRNPGFWRDKAHRLEASASVDLSRASGTDVVALLWSALRYLSDDTGSELGRFRAG